MKSRNMKSSPIDDEKRESIEKISRALGRNHPLRQQALAVLADPEAAIPDVLPALTALTDPLLFRKKARTVAFWLVMHGNWSEGQRLALSEGLSIALDRTMQSRKTGRVAMRWFLRGMFVSLPLACALMKLHTDYRIYDILDLVSILVGLAIYTAFLTVMGVLISLPLSLWIDGQNLRQFCPVIEALGHVGQPRSLAPLAKAAVHLSLNDRAVITAALTNVTGRLRPDDYGTLPPETVTALSHALTVAPLETEPVILQALTMIGDERAIPAVEHLLQRATRPDLLEAALKLLPILQQRGRDNQAYSMLLRPGSAPADTGQILLRPSWEHPTTDPSQLLRVAPTEGSADQNRER